MFIRPLDITLVTVASWQNHAGNTHFTLQSKKKDSAVKSFFSGIGQSLTLSADLYRRSIAEYDFRVIMNIRTRSKQFIVAVDDSFDKIHNG